MGSEIGNTEANEAQRKYGRLAGCLYLGVIIAALAGGLILSHVAGSGDFDETAKRIVASGHLYRLGLSIAVIASFGSALLAFTLYATLKPVDSLLAQLAMIFCLGDSFLALVVRMCGFVRVQLYVTPQTDGAGMITVQTLVDLMRKIGGTTENLGGISFGIGSLLFFYLFFKSSYIPRILAALGLLASVIWTGIYFANLVFPEAHSLFQLICFPPMALAEVITGIYLMLFTLKARVRREQTV
jgi:MFS family permease